MKECELFAPSALIQSCARISVTSYALGGSISYLQKHFFWLLPSSFFLLPSSSFLLAPNSNFWLGCFHWDAPHSVYSSREGTEAWFTTAVRERRLDLQQSWGNGGLGLQQSWGNDRLCRDCGKQFLEFYSPKRYPTQLRSNAWQYTSMVWDFGLLKE